MTLIGIKMRRFLQFGKHRIQVQSWHYSIPRRGAIVKQNYRFIDTKRVRFNAKRLSLILQVIFMILMIRKNNFNYLSTGVFLIYWKGTIRNTKICFKLRAPRDSKKRDGHNLQDTFFRYCNISIEIIPGMGAKLTRSPELVPYY